ncbi:MAG: hypothetical protein RLZZ292_1309 [Bacteroidota bacterium]|jgi:hypothetical protein
MKKFFLYFIFIFFISQTLLFAQSENSSGVTPTEMVKGQSAVVIAFSGLKIRKTPSFEGKTLGVAPFGSYVQRFEPNFDYATLLYTQDSIPGHWERIRYGSLEGYAFNAFLGDEIMKIKDKYTLVREDEAWCWNDCYASLTSHYNYYAVLMSKDSSRSELKKFTPTFYNEQAVKLNCPDKRTSSFILITKDEIAQGAITTVKKNEMVCGTIRNDNNNEGIHKTQKVKIPETNWVLESKEIFNKEWNQPQSILFLRDTKTGVKQQLSDQSENCKEVVLIWCGDLDRDGIMDFMLSMGDGEEGYGIHLFLSRDAPQGKLVKPAGHYYYQDCC